MSTRVFLAALALWAGLRPGPFPLGYRHVQGVDLWYPAGRGGRAMRFGEYPGTHADDLHRVLNGTDVAAKKDAAVVRGRHPLVLIAHGNGEDAADQAILSEYLASHGYVVASVPSPMIAHPMTDESQVGAFAEEQADALEKAERTAAAIFRVRTDREAVIGHSFGARTALLYAMRHRNVRALVSLDGGIGTSTGIASLKSARSFCTDAHLPPLLHIYEDLDPFMKPDFLFLEELRPRKVMLRRTSDMHHVHFTTYGFASSFIPEIAAATKAGPRIRENVSATAEAVVSFLDRNLF